MNGFLLDTHVVLWWLSDPTKLAGPAHDAITAGTNPVFMSAAAAWEMAIKKSMGRLDMPANLAEVLAIDHISVLDVSIEHALGVANLPILHHDPFDRLQIVQAQIEGLTLITRDEQIQRYAVEWLAA